MDWDSGEQELRAKVDALQAMPWVGLGGMAVSIAVGGWLVHVEATFPLVSVAMLGSGFFGLLLVVGWAMVAVAMHGGFDLPIGPDPEVLVWLMRQGVSDEDWRASREELAQRIHEYNRTSTARASGILQRVRTTTMVFSAILLGGFAVGLAP